MQEGRYGYIRSVRFDCQAHPARVERVEWLEGLEALDKI